MGALACECPFVRVGAYRRYSMSRYPLNTVLRVHAVINQETRVINKETVRLREWSGYMTTLVTDYLGAAIESELKINYAQNYIIYSNL